MHTSLHADCVCEGEKGEKKAGTEVKVTNCHCLKIVSFLPSAVAVHGGTTASRCLCVKQVTERFSFSMYDYVKGPPCYKLLPMMSYFNYSPLFSLGFVSFLFSPPPTSFVFPAAMPA